MTSPEDSTSPQQDIPEPAERIVKHMAKESRSLNMRHEDDLSHSLKPFRVGSVAYLNAVPLTRGLEEDITFTTPAKLAAMLQRHELDAALVSVSEVLHHQNYDILDGISVSSLGEVKSVFLAHRDPIESIEVIHCDPASLTSVNLLQVLLAERGLNPEFKPLASYDHESLPDNTLLIGDPAIDFSRTEHDHQIWDLGLAWHELTGLPFVYAVWAIRHGIDHKRLGPLLRSAKAFGQQTLDTIIRTRREYDEDFRRDYLSWHIHYHLGDDEKAGLKKFAGLLEKHGLGPVSSPTFV